MTFLRNLLRKIIEWLRRLGGGGDGGGAVSFSFKDGAETPTNGKRPVSTLCNPHVEAETSRTGRHPPMRQA